MQDIRADGKIGLPNHAVGLGDTGKTAKGKKDEDGIIDLPTRIVNAAGYFQKTSVYIHDLHVNMMKGLKQDIQ